MYNLNNVYVFLYIWLCHYFFLPLHIIYQKNINMNISSVIKEKGYTIQQVADQLGVARITVAKSIGNNPKVQTLRSIAAVIGCDIADFFEDERKEECARANTSTDDSCEETGNDNCASVMLVVSERIRFFLRSRGMKAKELAAKANLSVTGLSLIMNGKSGVSIDTLSNIAKILDVELWQLFTCKKVSMPNLKVKEALTCPKCGTPLQIKIMEAPAGKE